jgi:hypothetical protein
MQNSRWGWWSFFRKLAAHRARKGLCIPELLDAHRYQEKADTGVVYVISMHSSAP